jgi:hypothetical protein
MDKTLHLIMDFTLTMGYLRSIWISQGKPWFWIKKSCAGYYSCIGGKHLSRTLESIAGINPLVRHADQGKPLPWTMEPRARLSTCAHQSPHQQPKFSWQPGASQILGSFSPIHTQQPKLPFLATLHFPELSRLLNDLICHDLRWPPMPTKLPSDIPKFKGKPNEDPGDHVTTFHLWCSSNSLREVSIQLHLFQCTLIESAAKWYIKLNRSRYSTFGELVIVFLNHFQLPMRYDVGTKFWPTLIKQRLTISRITSENGSIRRV